MKRRVERIQLASRRRLIRAPIANANGIENSAYPGVQHRRVNRHRGMAQQRGQPDPLGGRLIEARERVRVACEQHQRGEEEGDPGEHRGRVRNDLAVAAARQVENPACRDRQDPGPEQQRPALARPHRGQPVAERGRSRGVVGDQRDREVRTHEGRLEDDHRDGQQRAEGVDRAAGRVDEALILASGAEQRRARSVETGEWGGDQARRAERDHQEVTTRGRTPAIIATPGTRLESGSPAAAARQATRTQTGGR